MPYERFTEVQFDYGYVIERDLWDKVQAKIIEMDNSRAKGTKRCYPLSGLLEFTDGSSFAGSGAWGKSYKST